MKWNRKISTKAIILGLLADFLFSTAFAILKDLVVLIYVMKQDQISFNEAKGILQESLSAPIQMIFELFYESAFTFLGGYVAGRVAKREFLLHGALVGGLEILLALALEISFGNPFPRRWLFYAAAFGLTLPAAIFGASLARGGQNARHRKL